MAEDPVREARFNQLYEQHFEAVRRYVWRRGPLSADDVAADTFVVAWRRLDDVPTNALPWLIAVARNTLLNERRRARRQVAVTDRLAAEPAPATDAPDTASSELIEAALAALSERDREVLLLSVWEDLDRAAIAEVLGCSKTNVSVRLHRARHRFADEMERQAPAAGSRLHAATCTGGFDA
ncbi:MAG: RNA polymerase sigma factor [Solirubrobacteraceae bacterium]